MKHLLLLFFLLPLVGFSQNLVPNFSFEEYSSCPMGEDEVQLSAGWFKYSQSFSTPDYYNSCAPSSGFSVPQSLLLHQEDSRGCNAYAGLVVWNNNGIREHIGTQLEEPMVIGQKYYLSFKTVMGGGNIGGNYFENASNNVGLKLSTTQFTESEPAPIDNHSHLRLTEVFTDTLNWLLVSGSIVADSAYDYVMMGNFYDNLNTDTMVFNCMGCLNQYSYYLIDDVCVSVDSLTCNGELDELPCSVSVDENVPVEHIRLFPNPATDWTEIIKGGQMGETEMAVYSMNGRLLLKQTLIGKETRIDLSEIDCSGLLVVNINSNNYSSTLRLLKL